MAAPLRKPCPTCHGTGLVPRAKRRLDNGEIDPFDTVEWPSLPCETCTGMGSLVDRPKPEERANLLTGPDAGAFC